MVKEMKDLKKILEETKNKMLKIKSPEERNKIFYDIIYHGYGGYIIDIENDLIKLKEYKEVFPDDVIFEVITREAKHILAPSRKLTKVSRLYKWSFSKYKKTYFWELTQNKQALKYLETLYVLSKSHLIFLVSHEVNPSKCYIDVIYDLLTDNERALRTFSFNKSKEIKTNYEKGFNHGMDTDWDWTQCAISRLINKGKLPENTRDLIFNEIESITVEEFDEWYDIAYPNEEINKENNF